MIYKTSIGKGEKVAILHGWSCDHRHMQPLVDLLSDRYHVTNIDLPGRGQSDWKPGIKTIHDIADLLLPHLPKKAIYIAWSFGGLVSISIAARYPERVKRFIGIATTPKFVEEDHWAGISKPGFKLAFLKIKQIGLKAFFKEYYDHEFADFDPKPASYEELIRLLDNSKINIDILLKGIDICDSTDLRKEFQSICCPIDLILSEQDESIPMKAFENIEQLNPNVRIHPFPKAHHMPFWTHPKQFNYLLNHVLSTIDNIQQESE